MGYKSGIELFFHVIAVRDATKFKCSLWHSGKAKNFGKLSDRKLACSCQSVVSVFLADHLSSTTDFLVEDRHVMSLWQTTSEISLSELECMQWWQLRAVHRARPMESFIPKR